jgi:uncharacterized protein (TIGR02611 family)
MIRHIIHHSKKLAVAIIGTLVLLAGILMLAYPGPGILVVFAGLAILATEFKFAQGLLENLRAKYEKWKIWFNHQHISLRIFAVITSVALIVITAWLLNTFGLINQTLNLQQDWLASPLLFLDK